jgi:hypothetical protein
LALVAATVISLGISLLFEVDWKYRGEASAPNMITIMNKLTIQMFKKRLIAGVMVMGRIPY